ncbi:N-acetyltransferase [Roseobacter cerasinus]|uniref:N-acetyltransferase n=1 Tax=Roseobacter cerasinus TaxID=2602289 RepID=A0A640VQ11_9RHOB|nr:GNAT family N-acetyltransferase [Roseobacter cerasinus]GFE48955.1 N-acetyltransferase [Roseobacter cerasinus]
MLNDGFHDVPRGKLAVVITYLEMTTKVATEANALPEGVTFRQVTPDVPWYRDILTRVGGLDWLWFGRLRQDDAVLEVVLADPDVEFYTLSRGGVDLALMELDFRKAGACELQYFGLTSELIGTGAGRYLITESIERAWSKPISRFHLSTCTIDSPQALGFYRHIGFTPVKQAVQITDDPRLIGLLPESAGPHVPILRP